MKLKEALLKAKPGQVIKPLGNSFRRGTEYYGISENGSYYLSAGGSAGYSFKDLNSIKEDVFSFWGIYSTTEDHALIES